MDTAMLQTLRKRLHENAEPSMQESRTRQLLMSFLHEHTSLPVTDCGSWFYVKCPGDSALSPVAFRADFDAVLCADGIARHLCGHDGHSTILCGLAMELANCCGQLKRDVYLIFQPGEETGSGALLCSELISEKGITEIYGFHNIPSYPVHSLVLPAGTFACASTGMEIRFDGMESHAAYPEEGRNPASAIAALVLHMDRLIKTPHKGILLGTVIGIDAGSRSYGVSAGTGTLRLTLRAQMQSDYDSFIRQIEDKAHTLADQFGLSCSICRIEEFPATVNPPCYIEKVHSTADALGLQTFCPGSPFRWSEDFGHYLQHCDGCFFGIGCGTDHPGLHTPEYEFEDEIIPTVISLFRHLI